MIFLFLCFQKLSVATQPQLHPLHLARPSQLGEIRTAQIAYFPLCTGMWVSMSALQRKTMGHYGVGQLATMTLIVCGEIVQVSQNFLFIYQFFCIFPKRQMYRTGCLQYQTSATDATSAGIWTTNHNFVFSRFQNIPAWSTLSRNKCFQNFAAYTCLNYCLKMGVIKKYFNTVLTLIKMFWRTNLKQRKIYPPFKHSALIKENSWIHSNIFGQGIAMSCSFTITAVICWICNINVAFFGATSLFEKTASSCETTTLSKAQIAVSSTPAAIPCKTYATGGTANGAPCRFPFKYLQQEYNGCITFNNNGSEWCSTVSNYDLMQSWGNCAGTHQ